MVFHIHIFRFFDRVIILYCYCYCPLHYALKTKDVTNYLPLSINHLRVTTCSHNCGRMWSRKKRLEHVLAVVHLQSVEAIEQQTSPVEPLEPIAEPLPRKLFIVSSNARALAALAHQSRRERKLAAIAKLEAKERQFGTLQEPAKDPFLIQQRDACRARLRELQDQMKAETDASKKDRLAAAYAKLAESERQFDGRPLPGSLRPAAEKRSKAGHSSLTPE